MTEYDGAKTELLLSPYAEPAYKTMADQLRAASEEIARLKAQTEYYKQVLNTLAAWWRMAFLAF